MQYYLEHGEVTCLPVSYRCLGTVHELYCECVLEEAVKLGKNNVALAHYLVSQKLLPSVVMTFAGSF